MKSDLFILFFFRKSVTNSNSKHKYLRMYQIAGFYLCAYAFAWNKNVNL